jgi:hypothetical protein
MMNNVVRLPAVEQVPLLRANPHQWAQGRIHELNEDNDLTLCGQSPARCPAQVLGRT